MRPWFANQHGAIGALAALMLPVFIGMAALVVDMGVTWQGRRHLQNCSDAAALAGVSELDDTVVASSVALDYLYVEGACLKSTDPAPTIRPIDRNGDGIYDALEVVTYRDVPYAFAGVLGFGIGGISARAMAGKVIPRAFLRMDPFGVQADPGQECGRAGVTKYKVNGQALQLGKSYNIKYSAGGGDSGSPGNFQALALGGTGAKTYQNNVENSYRGWTGSCDAVETEPGNMVGPTIRGLDLRVADDYAHLDPWADVVVADPAIGHIRWSDCPRVVNLAIIAPLQPGRTTSEILTFGWFLVEEYHKSGNTSAQLRGRFITVGDKKAPPNEWIGDAPWDPTASLPFGIKLLE